MCVEGKKKNTHKEAYWLSLIQYQITKTTTNTISNRINDTILFVFFIRKKTVR